jgi:phosphoglycolate phosphatase
MSLHSVVFDFDGTLLDSKPGIVNCLQSVGAAYDLNTQGVANWIIGPPAEVSIRRLMPHVSEEKRHEFLIDFRKCYALNGWSDCSLYPGVVDLLDELKRNSIRAYICTSKRKDMTLRLLDHFHLREYFVAVEADEDHFTSHDKKDLLRGLVSQERIDASSCAMVGDSTYDMDAAHATGLKAVAVLYGYGRRDELIASGPDALCSSPWEVFAAIDRL